MLLGMIGSVVNAGFYPNAKFAADLHASVLSQRGITCEVIADEFGHSVVIDDAHSVRFKQQPL